MLEHYYGKGQDKQENVGIGNTRYNVAIRKPKKNKYDTNLEKR